MLGWLLSTIDDDPIYVVYNRGTTSLRVTLPPPPGTAWYRVADTGAWMEPEDNISTPGTEHRMAQATYDLAARSLAVFVAR